MPVKWRGRRKVEVLTERLRSGLFGFIAKEAEDTCIQVQNLIPEGPRNRMARGPDGTMELQMNPAKLHLWEILQGGEQVHPERQGSRIWAGIGYIPVLNRHVGSYVRASQPGVEIFSDEPIWAMLEFGTVIKEPMLPRGDGPRLLTIWKGDNYKLSPGPLRHPGILDKDGGPGGYPGGRGRAYFRRTAFRRRQDVKQRASGAMHQQQILGQATRQVT